MNCHPLKGFALLVGMCLCLLACTKKGNDASYRPPLGPPDPLSGQEFTFTNLTWAGEEIPWNNKYVDVAYLEGIEMPQILATYSRTSGNFKVSVQFHHSNDWVLAQPTSLTGSHLLMYDYNSTQNSLFVYRYPIDTTLIGRKASLKIKVL